MKQTSTYLRWIQWASVLILALVSSGCASIAHSGSREVTVETVPPGAHVTVRKSNSTAVVTTGTTPMSLQLSPRGGFFRGQPYDIELSMDGYESTILQVKPALSPWYLGNIIFGGAIGLVIVDPATGAMWDLAPNQISYPLSQLDSEEGVAPVEPEGVTAVSETDADIPQS